MNFIQPNIKICIQRDKPFIYRKLQAKSEWKMSSNQIGTILYRKIVGVSDTEEEAGKNKQTLSLRHDLKRNRKTEQSTFFQTFNTKTIYAFLVHSHSIKTNMQQTLLTLLHVPRDEHHIKLEQTDKRRKPENRIDVCRITYHLQKM